MGAGICLFSRLGNEIFCTGNGIHERKTIEKWVWDFNLSNRQAEIVDNDARLILRRKLNGAMTR